MKMGWEEGTVGQLLTVLPSGPIMPMGPVTPLLPCRREQETLFTLTWVHPSTEGGIDRGDGVRKIGREKSRGGDCGKVRYISSRHIWVICALILLTMVPCGPLGPCLLLGPKSPGDPCQHHVRLFLFHTQHASFTLQTASRVETATPFILHHTQHPPPPPTVNPLGGTCGSPSFAGENKAFGRSFRPSELWGQVPVWCCGSASRHTTFDPPHHWIPIRRIDRDRSNTLS